MLPLFTMSMPVSQPPPRDLLHPSITRLPMTRVLIETLALPERPPEEEPLKTLAPGTGKVRTASQNAPPLLELILQTGKFAELQTDDTGNPGRFLQ